MHDMIMLLRLSLDNSHPPESALLNQPGGAPDIAARTDHHQLLGEIRDIRPMHGVESDHRSAVVLEHGRQRFTLVASEISQHRIRLQFGGQSANDGGGHLDGNGDDGQIQTLRYIIQLIPVALVDAEHVVIGSLGDGAVEPAHTALSSDEPDPSRFRCRAREGLAGLAGSSGGHDHPQKILCPLRIQIQSLCPFSEVSGLGLLTFGHEDRQLFVHLFADHVLRYLVPLFQQLENLLVDLIDLLSLIREVFLRIHEFGWSGSEKVYERYFNSEKNAYRK